MTQLNITTEYDAYYPGTDVLVTVGWNFDSNPEKLELRVVWSTAGKGTRDLSVVMNKKVPTSGMSGSSQVTIKLPWGPYSFSGKLLSLIWAFEVVAIPSEVSTRKEFTLGPNASEVLITPP